MAADASRRRRYRYYREYSPALILVGALILYHFAPQYLASEGMEGWTRTEAKILLSEARREGGLWNSFWNRHPEAQGDGPGDATREWRVFLAYEFTDPGGTVRRGEGTFGDFRKAEAERMAGGLKTNYPVWYDPADPGRSALTRIPRRTVTFACGVGLALVALGGLIFLVVAFAQKDPDDGVPDWAALPR